MKVYFFIAGVFIVIVLSLIALNASFRQTLQMEMADQFNRQQLLLAKTEASNIQAYINNIKEELVHIARFPAISQRYRETDFSLLTDVVFTDIGEVNKRIEFLDSRGTVIFSRGTLAPADSDGRNFIESMKKACPAGAQIKQDARRVYIIVPVCRPGSRVDAVAAYMDIQDIGRAFLGPIKSGARGYAWMVDEKGNLLYHPQQHEMVGRNLYKADSSCFKCHKTFDVEKRMIEGKGDYFGRHVAPTGEDKILAFSTALVGDSRWIVAVSAPYSEVTMSISRSMKFYFWIIILIFLAASGATAMMIDLNRRREKAEAHARHEKELEKYAAELEEKVENRTKELSEEKEKLNTIVSAMGSGLLLIDTQGKILWINRTMEEIAGKDITGMLCEQICADCTVVSSYEEDNMQTEIMSNLFGSSDRYYQVITAPVKNSIGEVHAYIRLVQDVTEMKKIEEQMMHTEKLVAMERLTSGMANEIGNPLTSIFSFVQVLLDMEEDEFKKETLETIYFHMGRISDILKQLSSFSRMPSLELTACKVNSLIANSLSLIQYDKRVQDITIVRELMPDILQITTDGNKLSQVFVNIMLNAVDAMENGGTLTIRSRVEDRNIVIEFEDTGVGIDKEELGKIFDPFHTTKEQGKGMGLAVSYNIIKKLGGSLTVRSELNKGSRFKITLPVGSQVK